MIGLKQYLKERQQSSILRIPKTLHGVEVEVKDRGALRASELNFLLQQIEETISADALKHLKLVKIGNFDVLKKENYKSYYKDGVIYLSNDVKFIEEMMGNFFHELAHSLEKTYYDKIYGDGFLEKEFLNKRHKLKDIITMYEGGMAPPVDFSIINYSKDLDDYLVDTIGYDKLWQYCAGLFTNPYAATSLREYFASGFEKYLKGESEVLDRLCPVLYNKVKQFF